MLNLRIFRIKDSYHIIKFIQIIQKTMKPAYFLGLFLLAILITPIRAPLPALLPLVAMFGAGSLLGPKLMGNSFFGGKSEPQTTYIQLPQSSSSYDSYGGYPAYGGMPSYGMGGMGGMGGGAFGQPMMMGGGGGGGMGGYMSQGGGGSVGGGFGGGQYDFAGKRKRRSLRQRRSANWLSRTLIITGIQQDLDQVNNGC
ncbi:unnamed protein product [Mytilus coruscus]|uniref:Uncharacterized protein n=1 Tax=Mytilus coruscus TaxID=42192 RepID=A0A6J8EPH2_MYTCO|nr:unnamed protein product [Mytilus coruscus]